MTSRRHQSFKRSYVADDWDQELMQSESVYGHYLRWKRIERNLDRVKEFQEHCEQGRLPFHSIFRDPMSNWSGRGVDLDCVLLANNLQIWWSTAEKTDALWFDLFAELLLE